MCNRRQAAKIVHQELTLSYLSSFFASIRKKKSAQTVQTRMTRVTVTSQQMKNKRKNQTAPTTKTSAAKWTFCNQMKLNE
jgi:hypothetical protein